MAVLNETADAVGVVLRANTDWSLSGLRDTQYAVDLRADAAALEVLTSAGVAMKPSTCEDLRDAVVGISGIPKQRPQWAQFRALGAAALDICLVADGVIDAWIDFNTHGVWDYLASALICQEAGAQIVEHQGRSLVVHEHGQRRTPIAAATPNLLAQVKTVRDQKS